MKTDILKPRANVRNIVGQELPTFDTGQTLSYVKTDSTSLANYSQHWKLLANNVESFCKGLKVVLVAAK